MSDNRPVEQNDGQFPKREIPQAPQSLQTAFIEDVTKHTLRGMTRRPIPEELFVADNDTRSNHPFNRLYHSYLPTEDGPVFPAADRMHIRLTDPLDFWMIWDSEVKHYLAYQVNEKETKLNAYTRYPHFIRAGFVDGKISGVVFESEVMKLDPNIASKSTMFTFYDIAEDEEYRGGYSLAALLAGGRVEHAFSDEDLRAVISLDKDKNAVVIDTVDINGSRLKVTIPTEVHVDPIEALKLQPVLQDPFNAPTSADDYWRRKHPLKDVIGVTIE